MSDNEKREDKTFSRYDDLSECYTAPSPVQGEKPNEETCKCAQGPYEGARPIGWPRYCERCNALVSTPSPEGMEEAKNSTPEENLQVMESPLVTLTRDNDKLRADNEALRAMLKRITKVESWDYDLMTEKVETSTYSFEEVWHMGERRARYAQKLAEDKAVSLRTQLEQAQKENEELADDYQGLGREREQEINELKSLISQMVEALEKLGKGNRSPGVLRIAQDALKLAARRKG